MKENESEFLATLIAYIIVGVAIFLGIYVAAATDKQAEQTTIMAYNMPSDFREKTDIILTNIDPEIREHISSINVIDETDDICVSDKVACIKINFDIFGGITGADIYLINNYDNKCYNFEWVLYHEIGHVEEYYKYGKWISINEDYADNFANQYSNNNCRRR